MRARHLVPNAVTLLNIGFGFLGMVAAARGHFERAVVLLFCAAMCDMADGKLARALDACSQFGMELDSLSDMVSFGIAPALLVYTAVLEPLGLVGLAVALVYPLAGAVRLARYNSDASPLGHYTFLGCPIPIAASYLWSMVLVRDSLPAGFIAAGTLLAAIAMVSTLKVPKFRRGQGLPSWMMFTGLALFVVFLVRPSALTWHLWNGWNVVLIGTNYVFLGREGHLRPTAASQERDEE